MLQDHRLYSITRNLGLPEIDLFTTMAQILEIRRYLVEEQNPECLKTYDKVVEALLSRSNLEELVLVGDDKRNGRFSIRIMMGLEPVQFNVWAYSDRVQTGRSKLPGDLLRWKGRVLTHRARPSYYRALGLLDSILANGGLIAVSPTPVIVDDSMRVESIAAIRTGSRNSTRRGRARKVARPIRPKNN